MIPFLIYLLENFSPSLSQKLPNRHRRDPTGKCCTACALCRKTAKWEKRCAIGCGHGCVDCFGCDDPDFDGCDNGDADSSLPCWPCSELAKEKPNR